MNTYRAARGLVILGVAFASLSAIFIRISDAPPVIIAFYRMLFTSVMIVPLFFAPGGRKQDKTRSPGPTPRDMLLLATSGVFLAIHFASWNASLSYTTVASSVVLVTLHPMFVALGSIAFLGEHVPARAFGFIALAIAGSAVLSYGDLALGPEALYGNLLAVIGALAVAGYMLIGRFLRRSLPAKLYNLSVYSVAAAVLLLLSLSRGALLWPYPPHEFLIFAALAFFCTILGHSIFNWALKYVSASSVSTSILLEPIFATIMALVLFGEIPGTLAIAGGSIVVLALYMVLRTEQEPKREPQRR